MPNVSVCGVLIAELADASAIDAVDAYADWHRRDHQQPVISPAHPPQQALYPPTAQSSSPTPADAITSRELVVVPAAVTSSSPRPQHAAGLASAIIVDSLLTAIFVHGTIIIISIIIIIIIIIAMTMFIVLSS